jgi:hypothetical protein
MCEVTTSEVLVVPQILAPVQQKEGHFVLDTAVFACLKLCVS